MNKVKTPIEPKDYQKNVKYIFDKVKLDKFKNGITKVDLAKSVNLAAEGGFFKKKIRELIGCGLMERIDSNNFKFTKKAFKEIKTLQDEIQGFLNLVVTSEQDKKVDTLERSEDYSQEKAVKATNHEDRLYVPYDTLVKAIEVTRGLYLKFNTKVFTKEDVDELTELKDTSSLSRRFVTSLKKYGLIVEESDKLKLAKDGILVATSKSLEEKSQAILKCFKRISDYEYFKDLNGYIDKKTVLIDRMRNSHTYSKEAATIIAGTFLSNVELLKSLGLIGRVKLEEPVNAETLETNNENTNNIDNVKCAIEVTISSEISCGKAQFKMPTSLSEVSEEDLKKLLLFSNKIGHMIADEFSRR